MVLEEVPLAFLEEQEFTRLTGKLVFPPRLDDRGTLMTISSTFFDKMVRYGGRIEPKVGDEITAFIPDSYTNAMGLRIPIYPSVVMYAEGVVIRRHDRVVCSTIGRPYHPSALTPSDILSFKR